MSDEIMHNISRIGNFAWVCIPKVATVSIRQALVKQDPEIETVSLEDLIKAKDDNPSLFVFAFIRDPVSRLVSCWRNIVQEANRDAPRLTKVGLNNDSSWKAFLEMALTRDPVTCDIHWRPQAKFVMREDRTIFPTYIGSLSCIHRTWAREIAPKTKAGTLLKTHASTSPRPEVTEDQVNRIREFYHEDEKLFDTMPEETL